MNLVEVFEGCRELGEHCRRVAKVHPALVVAPEVLTKLSAMPLLCGLQTGVLIGVKPSDLAMRRVSCAM